MNIKSPHRNKKRLALAVAVPLVVGVVAGALFFTVILPSHVGTPEVVADIDQHWRALEAARGGLLAEAPDKATQTGTPGRITNRKRLNEQPAAKGDETRGGDKRAVRPKKGNSSRPAKQIQAVDGASFIIPKALFDAAAKDPRGAFPGISAGRFAEGGRTVGFQLFGIDAGSPLHAAGLRSGDVITRVNGYALASTDDVLYAYAALRYATAYRIDILRGGQSAALYYRVE